MLSSTKVIKNLLTYATFPNDELQHAAEGLVAQLQEDLNSVGFEPSGPFEKLMFAAESLMSEVDAEDDSSVDALDENDDEDEDDDDDDDEDDEDDEDEDEDDDEDEDEDEDDAPAQVNK